MRTYKNLTLHERIVQHFQHHDNQLVFKMLLSLDDSSLQNIYFVDFMTEFAATPNGYSQNMQQLSELSCEQLDTLQQFLLTIKGQCPPYFIDNIKAGLRTIQNLLKHTSLVS